MGLLYWGSLVMICLPSRSAALHDCQTLVNPRLEGEHLHSYRVCMEGQVALAGRSIGLLGCSLGYLGGGRLSILLEWRLG